MGWRTRENLGSGRFGVVFECRDKEVVGDDWPFALKRIQKDWLATEEVLRRFKRETDIQSELDHPNVMPVLDVGASATRGPWFVMPRATHGSLKDAIADGRTSDQDWTLRVFEGVLAGVAHAHERDVFHRDIKPSNILLIGDEPRIADFGIARQIDVDETTLTRTEQELGTLRYMAPEQFKDAKRAGAPADVYALGKVLCHALSGRLPEPLQLDLAGVPTEYRYFIDKCCRDEPSRRYQTAGEALSAFRKLTTPVPVILPPLEHAEELAAKAEAALHTDEQSAAIEELEAHFRRYPNEREMHMEVLPRLSRELSVAWIGQRLTGFRSILTTYDTFIEASNLVFGYCDVVARFYRDAFRASEDIELKRITLTRLLLMGHHYNRFFVHDVVVELLPKLDDACDIAVAEEVIEDHSDAASWYAGTALKQALPGAIESALRASREDG